MQGGNALSERDREVRRRLTTPVQRVYPIADEPAVLLAAHPVEITQTAHLHDVAAGLIHFDQKSDGVRLRLRDIALDKIDVEIAHEMRGHLQLRFRNSLEGPKPAHHV